MPNAFRRAIFAAALTLGLSGVSAASQDDVAFKVNRAEMVRLLGELPSVLPIRQDLTRLGFSGANLELAVAQAGSFYTDPTIAGYIADQVIAAYQSPNLQTDTRGLIAPMVLRGMGHLTLTELRYYYSVEQAMINALPRRDCGLAMRGRFSSQKFSDSLSRVAARLETDALREFYRIEFKAAQLGARRQPVRLTEATKRKTGAAIDERLEILMQAEPDADRLRAALSNLPRADNASACRAGRIFYQAIMTLGRTDLRNGLLLIGQP